MSYKLSDFDYGLPRNLIAIKPVKPRDHSRLLILDKETGRIEHKHFYDIINYLKKDDILVINNSKVIPARLWAKKEDTGGKVEVLLHQKINSNTWQCLLGRRKKEGLVLEFGKNLKAKILKDNNDSTWNLKFNKSGQVLMKAIEELGETPLPPYIENKRRDKKEKRVNKSDKINYQTIYALDRKTGSVAAPTAGFHFTPKLLKKIKDKGIKIVEITLYVGLGTFAPVKEDDIKKHKMHAEWVEIDKEAILRIKNKKGRVVAVGTTSARSLEAYFKKKQVKAKDFKAWVDIFIYPPYKFRAVDALITNFHLPKSTLLMLVSAFVGKKKIDKAYNEAVKKKYRFYSYGDAMFIK